MGLSVFFTWMLNPYLFRCYTPPCRFQRLESLLQGIVRQLGMARFVLSASASSFIGGFLCTLSLNIKTKFVGSFNIKSFLIDRLNCDPTTPIVSTFICWPSPGVKFYFVDHFLVSKFNLSTIPLSQLFIYWPPSVMPHL